MSMVIWGILLTLAGNVITSIGWVVQKYAHTDANSSNGKYYTKWTWWVGFL